MRIHTEDFVHPGYLLAMLLLLAVSLISLTAGLLMKDHSMLETFCAVLWGCVFGAPILLWRALAVGDPKHPDALTKFAVWFLVFGIVYTVCMVAIFKITKRHKAPEE